MQKIKIYFLFFSFLAVGLFLTNCKEESDICANSEELLGKVRPFITEIDVAALKSDYLDAEKDFLLIDVRQAKEYDNANIEGAVNLPRGILEFKINDSIFWEEQYMYAPEDTTAIIIYCKKGSRGALATQSLKELGYKNVKNLKGGYLAFESAQQKDEDE